MRRPVSCPLWLLCLHGKLTPEVHCIPKSSSKGCLLFLTIPMLPGTREAVGTGCWRGSRWPPHSFST